MLNAVFVWFLSHGSRLTVWCEMINIVQSCLRQGDKVKKLFDRKAKSRIYNRQEYRSKTSGGKSAYSRKLCGMFYVKQMGSNSDIRDENALLLLVRQGRAFSAPPAS